MSIIDIVIVLIISIIIGYIFGSIPTGYLVAKKHGVNIFEVGSKNPGSTNVGRVLGHKVGVQVFLLDLVKTWFGIFICLLIIPYYIKLKYASVSDPFLADATIRNFIIFYAGAGAILGHNYPFTTKFKGGKGITCTVAVIAYFNIFYAVILYLIHKLIGKLTGYVSLASILTLVILFVSACILSFLNIYPFNFFGSIYVLPAIAFMMVFGIARHETNIKRLMNGTENRIEKKL